MTTLRAAPFLLSLSMSLFVSLSGCSQAASLLKAKPAERAGFIPNAVPLSEDRERTPFHGNWYRNKEYFYERRDQAKKLVILPVRTDFLLEKGWWSELNSFDRSSYESDVRELAVFFREQIVSAFKEYDSSRWQIVDEPDDETLIIEYALVEVAATRVHLNAIGTTLGFFVPGGGLVSSTAGGHIAFEANIYDGKDGELLISFADREADKLSLASVRDYQFYGHARNAISEWAMQLADLAHSDPNVQIEDSLPVTLSPW